MKIFSNTLIVAEPVIEVLMDSVDDDIKVPSSGIFGRARIFGTGDYYYPGPSIQTGKYGQSIFLLNCHEFHETCHSVTFFVLVNSHQR